MFDYILDILTTISTEGKTAEITEDASSRSGASRRSRCSSDFQIPTANPNCNVETHEDWMVT